MRILITGHKGFVGTAFWQKLRVHGNSLTGCDLRDGDDVRDMFKTNTVHYDLVIHLAAIVGGRRTIEQNPLAVADDLSIDSALFQWAIRTKQERVVYFSSSAAYPIRLQERGSTHHLREDDIDLSNVESPDLTYGWSKLTGEYLAQFAEAEGVRTHVFRPFSGYGEMQALDYPFPSFIDRAKRRADPFEVWGDGEQVRDFIHIDDIVDATLEAVGRDITGPLNLGTGVPTAFNDLARLVTNEAGYEPMILHKEAEPVGVQYRVADTRKMNTFYTPKISLEEGIRRSLQR